MARPRKYPWDEWFAMEGGFTVEPGEDGVAADGDRAHTLVSMRAQVYAEAAWRQRKVKTRIIGDPFDDEDPDLRLQVTFVTKPAAGRVSWSALLDGRRHLLVQGKDFADSPEGFVSRARAAAGARRIDIRVGIKSDVVVLEALLSGHPRPLAVFFDQEVKPGAYRAKDLLEKALAFQGDGSTITPHRLAAAAEVAGLRRYRDPAWGSVWVKGATLSTSQDDEGTGGQE